MALRATITDKQIIGDKIRVAVHFNSGVIDVEKEYFIDDSKEVGYIESIIAADAQAMIDKILKIKALFSSINKGDVTIT